MVLFVRIRVSVLSVDQVAKYSVIKVCMYVWMDGWM